MHDVPDIIVRMTNFLTSQKKVRGLFKEAYINGVLTGLRLGEIRIRAGWSSDMRVIDVLADDKLPLEVLLDTANDFLPVGFFYTEKAFVRPELRTGIARNEYSAGIRLGFNYVIDLAEALDENKDWHETLNKTGRHLDWIRKYFEKI